MTSPHTDRPRGSRRGVFFILPSITTARFRPRGTRRKNDRQGGKILVGRKCPCYRALCVLVCVVVLYSREAHRQRTDGTFTLKYAPDSKHFLQKCPATWSQKTEKEKMIDLNRPETTRGPQVTRRPFDLKRGSVEGSAERRSSNQVAGARSDPVGSIQVLPLFLLFRREEQGNNRQHGDGEEAGDDDSTDRGHANADAIFRANARADRNG